MSAIHPAVEAIVALLIVVGGSFAVIGSFGLARFPSLMMRLHGPTKATTVGVGSCLVASMIYFPAAGGVWSAHELLITLFLFISAPISANMIAKAYLHQQHGKLAPDPDDAIEAGLPHTGGSTDWATFWSSVEPEGAQSAPGAQPEVTAGTSARADGHDEAGT